LPNGFLSSGVPSRSPNGQRQHGSFETYRGNPTPHVLLLLSEGALRVPAGVSSRRVSLHNVRVHGSLQSRVDEIRWYHTIDLGGGIVTRGVDDSPLRLSRLDLPPSLDGATVLDVGAWDGFFSFEAERRGASRVVSADYYSWHGSGWGSKQGFELARTVLSSRVEDLDVDVMDLSPERVGVYDVVLFLGVLYHLRHPLLALERVASVTRRLLVLETVVDMVGVRRPAAAFYPGRELNNDPTNWWGPNLPALHGMLQDVGFDEVRTVTPAPSAIHRAARAVAHKLRGKNDLRPAFRQDRAVVHASRRV
jgi:tRNA (mo5U34)-methyltransferase